MFLLNLVTGIGTGTHDEAHLVTAETGGSEARMEIQQG